MRTRKIVVMTLMGLLLLAVAAVAALFLVDPAVFRGQLEARAAAALGRQVQFGGPIRLERSLRPRIIVEDITIDNPDWTMGAHFATADEIGVQVALFPLLRGNLNVLDVSFSGVDLFIEQGPDGANNYTFGDRGDSEAPGVLPPVEQILIRDVVINYRSVDAGTSRYEIAEARLWNIPGQPERIEGQGSAKGMRFSIQLAADTAAELSGPQNPWSVKLDIEGPDMSLTLAGQMDQAFKWERGDYRITLSGSQADSLETLFGVQFPTSGPFEFSANVNRSDGSYTVTDIAARVQGPPETPVVKILDGEASGGQEKPFHIALQGRYGDAPLGFTFKSERALEFTSQTAPGPMEARLSIADAELNVRGMMTPATAGALFEFDARLQGDTLNTLAQLLDTGLPQAGPYQFSFHTVAAEGSYAVTELEGTLEGIERWKTIQILRGEASMLESGSVEASLDAKLDKVPLALSFQGGPGASGQAGATVWPVKLEASASGATFKGDGSIVTTENRKVLQIATQIKGNRFEALGPLIGVSLPAIGKFNLSADVSSDGDLHEANNLKIQMGTNRLTGAVRWEDKTPQPFLTAKLSSDRLTTSEFLDTASKPSSKKREAGLLDRPIKLDGLKAFDARLELTLNQVADSPIPMADIKSTVTLTNGKISAPIRAKLAGAPVKGQIQLHRQKNVPAVSLKATASKIDVGQTLKQLKMPEMVVGTADAVDFNASSTGKTLRALLEQAAFNLQIKPANLRYTTKIADQSVNITFTSAELKARRGDPLAAILEGTLNDAPFNADVRTANLKEIRKANASLPVRVNLQTADLQLKAEGTIARPFENNEFELKYELAGKEIQGLDPLTDFALPLRGAFRANGRISARGNRFTYEEDLRVGKSDLKANLTVLLDPPRPKISGRISATQIHLDDVILFEVDKDAAPSKDRSRVIPDYTVPVDTFLRADLDLDIKAERIRAQLGDLGDLVSKISLKNGRFKSSLSVTGFKRARISSQFDLNAAADPPMIKTQLNANNLNYGDWMRSFGVTDLVEGQIDLQVDLTGSGATRYSFLGDVDGRITIIGGPGRISGRGIDLWAADLIPTMLSPSWQRENVTETNCFVAHIRLNAGLAEIDDLLLDTRRVTLAASGKLDLKTETLDMIVAPRPKLPSLVSLANPVRIEGTLAEPEVSITRLPRRGRLAGAGFGLLAGLVNPAFLALALSDTGTGTANPCAAAVERIQTPVKDDSQ